MLSKLKTTYLVTTLSAIVIFTSCDNSELEVQNELIDFENVALPDDGYLGARDANGAHIINDVSFLALYNSEYDISTGTILSSLKDTETAGYTNSYSAYPGIGANDSEQFAIVNPPYGDSDPVIAFDNEVELISIAVTNSTYAALSMRDGDAFAKKFSAEDEDFFSVTFEGLDTDGNSTGTVEAFLADFRSGSNSGILDSWVTVDLKKLGKVKNISLSFSSSDVGTYGISTPLYVAIDDLIYSY